MAWHLPPWQPWATRRWQPHAVHSLLVACWMSCRSRSPRPPLQAGCSQAQHGSYGHRRHPRVCQTGGAPRCRQRALVKIPTHTKRVRGESDLLNANAALRRPADGKSQPRPSLQRCGAMCDTCAHTSWADPSYLQRKTCCPLNKPCCAAQCYLQHRQRSIQVHRRPEWQWQRAGWQQ